MMSLRAGVSVLVRLVVVVTLASAMACEGDEDDCVQCCECKNDGSPLVYRPDPSGECDTCQEQCDDLADRDFMGQPFDQVVRLECDE
jgi:hypothetical protein